MTPPRGSFDYVFPVVGSASFGDSYGAPRDDVSSGWHHGADIFAPFGAPVVAVADGTLTLVGWERLGGWRLWLQDAVGNTFYYAHLAGYTPLGLHATHVKAGQVLGFMGVTGDAITTPPHLHFEIHPASLLHLGYDGAVDPTSYLWRWRHLQRVAAPRPVHPELPAGAAGEQAESVFRRLLDALPPIRHPAHRSKALPRQRKALPTRRAAVRADSAGSVVASRHRLPLAAILQGSPIAAIPDGLVPAPAAARAPARETASLSSLHFAGLAAVSALWALCILLLLLRLGRNQKLEGRAALRSPRQSPRLALKLRDRIERPSAQVELLETSDG